MSVNPLQGIQVINSVNPCSSTPLHQPIYPYHYRAFPPLAELQPAPSPSPSPLSTPSAPFPSRVCSLARSPPSLLVAPSTPSSRNLDSPRRTAEARPKPPGLLEKVENCDYKDFSALAEPPPPQPRLGASPRVLLASFFPLPAVFTPFVVPYSFLSSYSPPSFSLSGTSFFCPFYATLSPFSFFEQCSRISLASPSPSPSPSSYPPLLVHAARSFPD